jgi:hypothetical protein
MIIKLEDSSAAMLGTLQSTHLPHGELVEPRTGILQSSIAAGPFFIAMRLANALSPRWQLEAAADFKTTTARTFLRRLLLHALKID